MEDSMKWWEERAVWVSGANGSWGSEFCRQLLMYPVARLVCFCRGELRGAQLVESLGNEPRVRLHLGDIRDKQRLRESVPHGAVVVHCAALKRVELAQGGFSPFEMLDVNVGGTKAVINMCLEKGVEKAFFVSSDKAVQPTTFYGATKMMGEEMWLAANQYSPAPRPPHFVVGRFGNALGSTGSVLRVWEEQRRRGQHALVYDPGQTRFVLVLKDMINEVLYDWLPCNVPPHLYVPDLPACEIADLATAYVGSPLLWDIRYATRGLGEKRHEILSVGGRSSREAVRLTIEELRTMIHRAGMEVRDE